MNLDKKQHEFVLGFHIETIECPECKKVQEGKVEYTALWNSYVHDCINCGYTIMESEWNRVETKTK